MSRNTRRAFSMMELLLALALLMVAVTMLGETAFWHMRQRTRCQHQEAALHATVNVLEHAAALPLPELTAEWARQQKLPESASLPGGRVQVEVADEKTACKKITVTVYWQSTEGRERSVSLTRLAAARTSAGDQR